MDGFRTQIADFAVLASQIPGNPLGPYGDVPVAYVVYKVTPDHEARRAARARYVYANPEYCRIAGCELSDIVGCSHLEVVKSESDTWTKNCYRAAILGESVNGIDYSPLARGWVCYNMAPTGVDGCFTCAFISIDDQERAQQASVEMRTAQVISEMLGALAGENGYHAAMNGMLEMAASALKPDRLIVFECHGTETETTFEWCAEGINPQIGAVYNLPTTVLNAWFKSVVEEPVALIPDVSRIAQFSMPLYEWLIENNVERFMAAPFRNEGNVVGFLGAYNYRIGGAIDVNRVFGTVSSFIGARIENHHLIERLAWAGEHDDLTGLLNRRGADSAFAAFKNAHPDAPYILALADINDFKSTNDQFGHAAGDRALCAMANAMNGAFPEDVILSRTGGDEFQIVLTGKSVAEADELLMQFAAGAMEYEHDGATHRISASVGYASYPDQAKSHDELFSKADSALYAVKNAGKFGCKKYGQ